MSQTRIYLPLSVPDLEDLADTSEVGPAPVEAYAVTAGLAASLPTADEEEREYAALLAAAGASAEGRSEPGDRRIVAAADVDDGVVVDPTDEGHTGVGGVGTTSRVTVSVAVPLRRIVSFHVDEVGGSDGDLLWYDVTELEELRGLVRR